MPRRVLKPTEREAALRHRRCRHRLLSQRRAAVLKQLKGGRRKELWVLTFKERYCEEKWSRDFELEYRTYSASGRYDSKLVLSKLRVNPKSGGARKDWVCWDPFDKSTTLLHRLAARVKLAMQGHRSVLQEGGFDQHWGDHNRGDSGHYKLLWRTLRAELQAAPNRAVFRRPAAAAS